MVYGPEAGYARVDIADWNNDGRKDLLVADEEARVLLYLNDGLGNDPPTFQPGTQLYANGKPLDGLGRGSILVCDWNKDGKKDLIMGMAPKDNVSSPYLDWPYQDGDTDKTDDEGFLYYKNTGPMPTRSSPIRVGSGPAARSSPTPAPTSGPSSTGTATARRTSSAATSRAMSGSTATSAPASPTPTRSCRPRQGTIIVEPFCKTQMISGADAMDWRGDGDLDIITGQGHGGSGLRFYERDYINDFVNQTVYSNDTFPVVTVGAAETLGASPTSTAMGTSTRRTSPGCRSA